MPALPPLNRPPNPKLCQRHQAPNLRHRWWHPAGAQWGQGYSRTRHWKTMEKNIRFVWTLFEISLMTGATIQPATSRFDLLILTDPVLGTVLQCANCTFLFEVIHHITSAMRNSLITMQKKRFQALQSWEGYPPQNHKLHAPKLIHGAPWNKNLFPFNQLAAELWVYKRHRCIDLLKKPAKDLLGKGILPNTFRSV